MLQLPARATYVQHSCDMKRSAIQACLAHPCCMAIFFGYKTAEHLLNSAGAPEFRPSVETPDRCGFVDAHALSSIDWTMFELPADEPLDIMVPSRNDRTRRKGFACHLATSDLPHGAYLEMMPDVFVARRRCACCSVAAISRMRVASSSWPVSAGRTLPPRGACGGSSTACLLPRPRP